MASVSKAQLEIEANALAKEVGEIEAKVISPDFWKLDAIAVRALKAKHKKLSQRLNKIIKTLEKGVI